MYYNVLHPHFFVLQRITMYYKMYYIVLQRITLYYRLFLERFRRFFYFPDETADKLEGCLEWLLNVL